MRQSLRAFILPVFTALLFVMLRLEPARASGQVVEATILSPNPVGPGVARREYTASGGTINGVHGYVFAVDPAGIGTAFTLGPAATNMGVGGLDITFYSDLVAPTTCADFTGQLQEAGVACGSFAIVSTPSGANLTFHYQSGLPLPTPPPFVASKFTFTTPTALPNESPSDLGLGNVGEPSISIQPGGPIYVSAPTGVPCGAGNSQCVGFWKSGDGGTTFHQPAPDAFAQNNPLGGGDSDVVVDQQNRVFVADLRTLTSVGVFRSSDQAQTWQSTVTGPCADRGWINVGGPNAPTGPNTVYEIDFMRNNFGHHQRRRRGRH